MLNVTLNSCIEMMKSLDCESEIILCDNSDKRMYELMPVAYPTSWLRKKIVKVIRQESPCFTSARHKAAEVATGEYIFCVDSHILMGYNTLRDSVNFMDKHKDNKNSGFGHPPIRWAHQGQPAIRYLLKISPAGLPNGGWDVDTVFDHDQQMFWKFMPWICRREWFLNTLKGYGTHAEAMLSWGGAELLMQMKSLMLGYENWAIYTDPIAHIGPYTPEVIKTGQYKYRTYGPSGNYPHGFGELVAHYVTAGPDLGYKQAKLGEESFKNRFKVAVDTLWGGVEKVARPEYEWLQEHKHYDYLELLENKPWTKTYNKS